ncbi:class II aldolase family protein [Plectosphaerella plurivora]|uniref:Class II aldolase family protein n=1 Tax=Plectosphaerella plurivora TaxID=936078 RepID=A0A9P9ADG7_9PEZI|nr:class II aldolase family protein [Plectosphaerella plurivora]
MAPSATSVTAPSVPEQAKSKPGQELATLTPLQAISQGAVPLPGIPTHVSFAAHRSWILSHMAAAFRHWARSGYVEGFSGHISVRDPENPGAFWTNPLGVHFGLLKASDMILVDHDGNYLAGNQRRPPNKAGFLIHSAVHKARPDVHAVCHAHSIYGKAWSVFGRPLDMITQDVCKFYGDAQAVYNAHGGVVLGPEEGERIAAALGPNGKGGILRNHGIITVGATVDEAAFLYTSMERSCQVQLLAESVHSLPKVLIGDAEAKFNFDAESDPEYCYCEFQVYYDLEEHLAGGSFDDFQGL